jgi:hypothetical protein
MIGENLMFSRGFRHSHQPIYPPVFLRTTPRQHDLLPWADPYIASLFHPEAELDENSTDDEQEELDPPMHR